MDKEQIPVVPQGSSTEVPLQQKSHFGKKGWVKWGLLVMIILILALSAFSYFYLFAGGKPCGGITGETGVNACPSGYACMYFNNNYPDHQGTCVKSFKAKPTPTIQQACTQEAKMCPDGSSVGRTGPNCEFPACPATQATSSADMTNWKTYTNSSFTFSYPSPWQIKEPTSTDDFLYVRSPGTTESTPYLSIRETKNESKLSFTDFATTGLNAGVKNKFTFTKEIVGKYAIYKTESLPGRHGVINAFVTDDESNYVIIGLTPYDSINPWPNQSEFLHIFNQILSTFKFLK